MDCYNQRDDQCSDLIDIKGSFPCASLLLYEGRRLANKFLVSTLRFGTSLGADEKNAFDVLRFMQLLSVRGYWSDVRIMSMVISKM